MATGAAADLSAISAALPDGLTVRVAERADLEAIVAFLNRFARPAQVQSVQIARRFEERNPQPNRLSVVVEDADRAIVALGNTSDGGVFASPDGGYRTDVRVAPEWRRRGIGSAMLARLEDHARGKSARKLLSSVRGDEPEGLAFAERRGYRRFNDRFEAYLDLATFDAARFEDPDAVAARAGARIADFGRLEGAAPDRIGFQRAVYELTTAAAHDIPRPDMRPPPPFEAVRELYFEGELVDRASTMIAVKGDEVIGATITTLNPAGVAYTTFTGVARAERGKGLALALKLRAIAALRAKGATLLGTTNDEQNAPMRGINAKLGYVADPPRSEVRKDLAP